MKNRIGLNALWRGMVLLLVPLLACTLGPPPPVSAADVIFLHHSVGRNIISEGNVRGLVSHDFWDHDYNYIGLTDPVGSLTGESYNIPGDNTDPGGLHSLWTGSSGAKASLLAYDVIVFKSCYSASDITSDGMLDQYKVWYNEIAATLGQISDKRFILLSPPPRCRNRTTPTIAARARAFAGHITTLSGRNVRVLDLFDLLAGDDNVLRGEYERTPGGVDSHPNAHANSIVGPILAELINEVADTNTGISAGEPMAWGGIKRLYVNW